MIPSNPIGPSHTDEITKKVEGLSPAKRTLLDLRMKKKEAEAAVEGGSPHREGRQKAALSFAQQRLWFLQQLETESPAYNVYGSVKLKGRLNEEALRRSLQEIVRRHEALRTRFVEVEGRAMQVVGGRVEVELPVIESSGVEEREREALRLAIEEASIPFDLERGPLLRGKLLRLGEEEHVLLLTVHHIVSDGWSVGVLVRELGVLHEAYAAGKESPLPELPIQYADYAEWQRENLQGEVLEEQLEYWRKQLGGELPVVELPGDHVRPAVRSYRGAQQELRVSREVTEKLKQMSQKEGATLFMTLLAAFDVLLARYSGQEELVVGTPIANRTRVETEEGLTGVVEYSTDLFEAGTMERLVGHWERLLEGIAEDAQQRVWELPLLGEAERRQVVEEWNQTEGWYPRDKTIVELFEEQVEKTPERVAVVYEGESRS